MNLMKRRTTKKREKVSVFKFSTGNNLLLSQSGSEETEMFQLDGGNGADNSRKSSLKKIADDVSIATSMARVTE